MNNQKKRGTNPKVICAFAGLGKTTLGKKYKNVCDLQSSAYKYDYTNIDEKDYEKMKHNQTRKRRKDWPMNYLLALKQATENYDLILVPANLDVRELLFANKVDFLFVLPSYNYRDILLERYKKRGNSPTMIENAMKDFDEWSRNQKDYPYPIVVLDKNKNLEDLMIELGYLNRNK